ncbi:uncharacterized protein G2W53_015703 [Senna tora]|uniref:Uncharacterized protein n=1 Tax=Senna tora TaxID=362788 RepID=A0A835C872_9FABA|nr:uncharacterized protein G2W53_015703 [Senna tora]
MGSVIWLLATTAHVLSVGIGSVFSGVGGKLFEAGVWTGREASSSSSSTVTRKEGGKVISSFCSALVELLDFLHEIRDHVCQISLLIILGEWRVYHCFIDSICHLLLGGYLSFLAAFLALAASFFPWKVLAIMALLPSLEPERQIQDLCSDYIKAWSQSHQKLHQFYQCIKICNPFIQIARALSASTGWALEERQNTKSSESSLEIEWVSHDLIMESTFFHFLYSEGSLGGEMDPSMKPILSLASNAVLTPMLHGHSISFSSIGSTVRRFFLQEIDFLKSSYNASSQFLGRRLGKRFREPNL